MSGSNIGNIQGLFSQLESNKLGDVEEIKKVFHDHFLLTKENWLVNGLFDYYLSTNSTRSVEVLAGVREPHDKHLLDRLSDVLAKPVAQGQKVQALTLLGHVAARQPTWLYKLASHNLFKELLKLLKVEGDTLTLMSALLLLVTLLPMLPAALGPYLQEIFEVFGRLASHYHQQSLLLSSSTYIATSTCPTTVDKDQLYLLHLQVALYSLFHRLYAMYPCNFISYLKSQYIQREQMAIFKSTISPMLDSVRMHPLLITASKEAEVSASRWKKMEHHDVVAECGRFALDRCREEAVASSNSRFTPILDHSNSYTPVSTCSVTTAGICNGDEDTFWSPSMSVPPHSPPPLQTSTHENRSTPSTPNNNRSGTSPPEAAVEATPETTPVKDMRQLSARQVPIGSAAVRALSAFGNGSLGGNSRPSTPTPLNTSIGAGDLGINMHTVLSQRINRLVADRQNALQQSQRSSMNAEDEGRIGDIDVTQNGKNDSWQEDQEVLEIVSSQSCGKVETPRYLDRQCKMYSEDCTQTSLSPNAQGFRIVSRFQAAVPSLNLYPAYKVRRSKSCPEMKAQRKMSCTIEELKKSRGVKSTEENGTQTCELVPYEHLLTGILDQRGQGVEQHTVHQNSEARLSPSSMLDKYIEACARLNHSSNESSKPKLNSSKQKQKKNRGGDEDGIDEMKDDDGLDADGANQLLQLMQMQLQFERQRRQVHAERNRRLLGKLRDSRALEEHNSALTDRLRLVEKEVESLKDELDRSRKELRSGDEGYAKALNHWQSKCVSEQQQNRVLRNKVEALELELKDEQKKVQEAEYQTKSAEAALFKAAHQLKGALRAAHRGEELKRVLDTVQKKFLLLGQAQMKLQESMGGPAPMAKEEASLIQKSYTEELANLRRQLESKSLQVEALKVRLGELEGKEVCRETQIVEQQKLLQEAKERHEAELQAMESKYKAQVEINLLFEGRILELHGLLETATSGANTAAVHLTSSASPKERSPPLSTSLASSSEGSLAIPPSGSGIMMNECIDPAGEIFNIQAIIEPAPSQATTPSRFSSQQFRQPSSKD